MIRITDQCSERIRNGAIRISKSMPRIPSLAGRGDHHLLYRPKRSSPSRCRNSGRYSLGCIPSQYVTTISHLMVEEELIRIVAISYAAEVCPVALRGYLTTYLNFCWGWGQLIGVGVIKGMFGRTDQWAYRIPYGLMVCPPHLLFTSTQGERRIAESR